MFQPNDYVVYGRSGVCRVDGVECCDGRDFYSLHSLYQNCRIKAPVDGKLPIRPVISKDEANALIDGIPSIQAKPVKCKNPRELNEKYRAAVLSQNCRDLIELTMSIYAKKQEARQEKKKINSIDEAFMKEGEALLFGELSVALGIPVDQVQPYIKQRVQNSGPVDSLSTTISLHKL